MQFAELVLTAKTEGLKQGSRDLDGLRASGARAEQGIVKSTSNMSSGFAVAARAAGALGAAMLATFGAASVVRGIAEFDQATAKLGAISRATTGEMEAMRAVAQDLGASTEFSATQAADALTFLSMAGFSARESLASIPAVLDLATAAGMGLAEAADTASNIMSGFGIAATEAASVTDILAAASTRANTNVSQLGSAMSTVAPISAALNISIEDTAASIGVLSDAGIQGERAGTALRGVLAALAGPTKAATDALASYGLTAADVDVSTRSLADVMTTLSSVGMSTADAMEIFGREAASGALVMIGASERVREFGAELRDVNGAASDMADQIRDNLTGDLMGLSSAAAGVVIALGDAGVTAMLRAATQATTALVRGVSDAINFVGDFRGYIIAGSVALAAAYTPAIIASTGAVVAATIATFGWVASLVTLRGALMATGIGAFVVLGGLAVNKLLELREETGSLGGAFALLGDVAVGVWDGIVTASGAIVPGLGAVWASVQADFFALMSALSEKWSEFLSTISLQIADAPGFGGISERLATSAGEAFGAMSRFDAQARSAERSAAALNAEAAAMAQDGLQAARDALARLTVQTDGVEDGVTDTSDAITQMTDALDDMEGATKSAGGAVKAADNETSRLTETLSGPLPSAIDGVSRAWADFVVTGFNDFQGFVSGVLNSFKRMLAEMIATAANNRIMLSMGMTGNGGGGAGLAGGGVNPMQLLSSGSNMLGGGQMLANVIGGGGLLAGTTFGAGLSATLTGGLSGGLGAFGAGASMGGLSGAGMMAGAAVPVVGAVLGGLALANSLGAFGGKKTNLNKGLNVGVGSEGLSSAQQFNSVRKSGGWFGRSRVSANERPADAAMTAYLSQSVAGIQGAARAAADALGIGAQAFDGFSHAFQIKLDPDASAEQMMQAINAELAKMGDAFSGVLPQFSSFNELLGAASERIALTDRLLALQGRDDELLARQRQRELDATHAVNRATLEHIFALEDQAVAAEAAAQATAEAARLAEMAAAEEARRRDDFSRSMMGSNLFATSAQRGFAASSYGMQSQPLNAATAEERALLREVVTAIREGNMNIIRHQLEQIRLTERATLEGLA